MIITEIERAQLNAVSDDILIATAHRGIQIMNRWIGIVAVLLLAAGAAWAQLVPGQGSLVPRTGPPCGMSSPLVPNCGAMVPNVATAVGPPPTPCLAGKFDLSLTTGCNLPFYLGGIFP